MSDIKEQAKRAKAIALKISTGLYLVTDEKCKEKAPDLYPALIESGLMLDAGPGKAVLSNGVGLCVENGPVYAIAASLNEYMHDIPAKLKELGIEYYRDGAEITSQQAKAELHRRGLTLDAGLATVRG